MAKIAHSTKKPDAAGIRRAATVESWGECSAGRSRHWPRGVLPDVAIVTHRRAAAPLRPEVRAACGADCGAACGIVGGWVDCSGLSVESR